MNEWHAGDGPPAPTGERRFRRADPSAPTGRQRSRRADPSAAARVRAAVVLLLAAGGLLSACGQLQSSRGGDPSATGTAAATGAATPTTRPTADRAIARTITAEGRLVQPLAPQPLAFKSAGTIAEVLVREGETVDAGTVLARIDPLGLDLAVADARALLLQAEAALARLADGTARETARLQVEQAKNQLWGLQSQRDATCGAVERAKKLPDALAQALPSETQCNQAQASVQAAEQSVQIAEAQLRSIDASAERELAGARANVERARLALRQAEASRSRAELTAPLTGTITSIHLVAGLDAGPGVPVVTLNPAGALQFATTNLGERYIGDVAVGAAATVTLNAFPEHPLYAVVRRIDPQGTVNQDGTVVFAVHLDVDPADLSLLPGMTGEVEIQAGGGGRARG